jgi:hypothetical protein
MNDYISDPYEAEQRQYDEWNAEKAEAKDADLRASVRRIADDLEAALGDEHTDRQYAAEKVLQALREVLS